MFFTLEHLIQSLLHTASSAGVPYEAYLEKGSDPDFRVYPATGQLLPIGTEGTLICLAYKPTLYGKIHNAKLVVQVGTRSVLTCYYCIVVVLILASM